MPLEPDPSTLSDDPDVRLALALERMATATREAAIRVDALHTLWAPVAVEQQRWIAARTSLFETVSELCRVPLKIVGENRIIQLLAAAVLAVVVLVWVGVDSEVATRAILTRFGFQVDPPRIECPPVTVEMSEQAPAELVPVPVPIPVPVPSEIAPVPVEVPP